MMMLSLGTGVYFGIVKKQKKTAEEFLMADRNMNVVPVSFSVIVRSVHCVEIETALQWRHKDHDGVSNHKPHDCLLSRLFRHISKKTSKLRVTGLCEGN